MDVRSYVCPNKLDILSSHIKVGSMSMMYIASYIAVLYACMGMNGRVL